MGIEQVPKRSALPRRQPAGAVVRMRLLVGAVTSYPVSALVFPSFREIFSES
jgi:hypothetical protein